VHIGNLARQARESDVRQALIENMRAQGENVQNTDITEVFIHRDGFALVGFASEDQRNLVLKLLPTLDILGVSSRLNAMRSR